MNESIEKRGYKTVLAEAARVDRNELPYALVFITEEGEKQGKSGASVEVHMCVHNKMQPLAIAEGFMNTVGSHMLKSMPLSPNMQNLSSQEQTTILGLATVTTASLDSMTNEGKELCGKLLTTILQELVIKGQSVEQAADTIRTEQGE